MRSIEIAVNGDVRWRAGIANAAMLAPILAARIADEAPAEIFVGGMCDLDQGRLAHVHWCAGAPLADGDVVVFRLTESENVTPPEEIVPTDSPQLMEERRAAAESLKNVAPNQTSATIRHPHLAFDCRLNGQPAVVATLVGSEKHILCSLLWGKEHPDRCRVSVRTFGDQTKPEKAPATEWLRITLALNDDFSVRIAV